MSGAEAIDAGQEERGPCQGPDQSTSPSLRIAVDGCSAHPADGRPAAAVAIAMVGVLRPAVLGQRPFYRLVTILVLVIVLVMVVRVPVPPELSVPLLHEVLTEFEFGTL
jgi:hypothetical protein